MYCFSLRVHEQKACDTVLYGEVDFGKDVGNRDQRQIVKSDEKGDGMCEEHYELDGEVPKYFAIPQRVAQGCTS